MIILNIIGCGCNLVDSVCEDYCCCDVSDCADMSDVVIGWDLSRKCSNKRMIVCNIRLCIDIYYSWLWLEFIEGSVGLILGIEDSI